MGRVTSCAKSPESLTATIHLRGRPFSFRLYTRPLRLGDYGTVQYYWMDSAQFRNLHTKAAEAQFRTIVGYWAAAMQEMGLQHDLDQQVHYVLAVCYALVGRCKRLQAVYRDAYLSPDLARGSSLSLADDVRHGVREVVQSRDRFKVQQELDRTLGRFEPPAKALPLLQEACRHWVGRGVSLMRRHDNDGLEQFLHEVDGWLAMYRKKGKHVWLRHFLNLFAYECKVAFYTCYANAWVGLIPWLREHRALDTLSERFLRFWHNQNPPIEIPHGQTPGGILYPTRQGVLVAGSDREGRPGSDLLSLQTERIGPAHLRDVFSGQVLSLHPLSGFFMKDPALCAVAGRFFGAKAYDLAFGRGGASLCSAYWDLIGVILSAAHLYRQALDQQANGRGTRRRGGVSEAANGMGDGLSDSMMLEDFASSHKVYCPACGGGLQFRRYHPAKPNEECFLAEYACRTCGQAVPYTIDGNDLEDWLQGTD